MKFEGARDRIEAAKSELSGSRFDDVNLSGSSFHNANMSGSSFDDINMSGWTVHNANLSGWKVSKVNLAGAAFSEGRYDGMTIDGIAVTDLLETYRAAQAN
jgi:uncharacterized protein YjbI with pentapeptide repeats